MEQSTCRYFVNSLLTNYFSSGYCQSFLVLCVPVKGGGDMRGIIEELYYGNITPSDCDIVRDGEYSHILQLLTRNEDELMKTLTQAQ